MEQVHDAVVVETKNVPAIADDQIILLAEQAEKRIEAIKKIKGMALKLTSKHDWVDLGGKPYLEESGANKVAPIFGISYQLRHDVKKIVHEDGHFSFEVWGRFVGPLVEIDTMGTKSSRDKFFSRSKGQDIPPTEIDENNVKKSAISNCVGNGVRRLLGLKNLTWEEVEQYTGFSKNDVVSVQYKKPGGGAGNKEDASGKPGSDKATKPMVKKLFAMLKKSEIDVDAFKKANKVESLDDIRRNNMSKMFDTWDDIVTRFHKWQAAQEQAATITEDEKLKPGPEAEVVEETHPEREPDEDQKWIGPTPGPCPQTGGPVAKMRCKDCTEQDIENCPGWDVPF